MRKIDKEIVFLILILLCLLPSARADVGVGLRWSSEELFINEFEEKCITYSVYNPFDTEVTAQLSVEREIQPLVKKIEPNQVYLPAYNGSSNDNAAKLANKKDISICFYANPYRWPPFYPINYSGVVLASAMPGKLSSTGSAAVSVVQAPLTLRIGSIQTFYKFIGGLSVLIAIVTAALLIAVAKKKLPKRKRKYCENCKKDYPYNSVYCPICGQKLAEKGEISYPADTAKPDS